MLKRWLSEGVLVDTAGEFMVVRLSAGRAAIPTASFASSFRSSISRQVDDAWTSLFDKAVPGRIPSMFTPDMVNKVRKKSGSELILLGYGANFSKTYPDRNRPFARPPYPCPPTP